MKPRHNTLNSTQHWFEMIFMQICFSVSSVAPSCVTSLLTLVLDAVAYDSHRFALVS